MTVQRTWIGDFPSLVRTPPLSTNPLATLVGFFGSCNGASVTLMPFVVDATTYDVLVASAKNAALVFFSNTTPSHKDIRAH